MASTERIPALIGCYFYYIGMDLVMYALVNFTDTYCRRPGSTRHHRPTSMYLALFADSIQMILNPFFGHAFEVQAVKIDGAPYYKLVPFMWQTVHRLVDYFIFFCVILIFILATVKAPKINKERYSVILVTMISVGLLQTYNILAKHNIDRSVLGYGVFGVVLFYFSIRYRPLRLLDRVLSNIVSGLSDAFYVFDPNGNCIWANDQGCTLADIKDNDYDAVKDKPDSAKFKGIKTVKNHDDTAFYVCFGVIENFTHQVKLQAVIILPINNVISMQFSHFCQSNFADSG